MATFTERYIHAATRSVPPNGRSDLARELEASIGDAVAARTDHGEPADLAERAVLTDMGDPAILAADYADRPLTLIGPRFYLEWWRLLKLLLWIVPPFAALAVALAKTIQGEPVGSIIGGAVVVALQVIVHVCFWVTLVFVILERTGTRPEGLSTEWTLDRLPEVERPGMGRSDLVASLVFLALTASAIAWDRFAGFVRVDGEPMPILDPGLWPWWITALAVVMVAEAALAIGVHRRGRWTPVLAAANTLLAAAVAVPAITLLVEGMLGNPAFLDRVFPTPGSASVSGAVMVVVIAGIALWDTVDGWYKAFRDRTA